MDDFERIYKAYFSDVYRYAVSLTMDRPAAEDLTEETFFRAMRALPGFRGECEVRVWLCRIAKNLWMTERKKRARECGEPPEELPAEGDFTRTAEDRDAALRVHRALHTLEEPYKEVFSLRIFGELSFGEIGALFGKTDHWACVTYHRAKEKIQKEMNGS